MKFERIVAWCAEAERGLAGTLDYDLTPAREGVNAGRLELWRVNDRSWLLTEIDRDALVVWAYRGRDACALTRHLFALARANSLTRIHFYTRRRGLKRLLRGFPFVERETLYTAEVP